MVALIYLDYLYLLVSFNHYIYVQIAYLFILYKLTYRRRLSLQKLHLF